MAKFFSWFSTPIGKKFTAGCFLAASCTCFTCAYAPHTLLVDKYRDNIGSYQMGELIPVPKSVQQRFQEAMDDLKLEDIDRKRFHPFTVFGFDVYHMGFVYSKFNSYVGVPINFSYQDVESINQESILIHDQPVNWSRPEAKHLLESLVLSPDAQRFAIARELLHIKSNEPLVNSCMIPFFTMVTYYTTTTINYKYNLFKKPAAVRMAMYFVVGSLSLGIYTALKDTYYRYCERKADETLAELGPKYVKGGLEYYDKLTKRNICLRSLLGDAGSDLYLVNGNERSVFRRKRVPLTQRKSFFNSKWLQSDGQFVEAA